MANTAERNGMLFALCKYCRKGIWRYVTGIVWRDVDMNSACTNSSFCRHIPAV